MNFKEWLIAEEGTYGLFEAGGLSFEKREQNAIKYAIMIAHFFDEFERMPSGRGSKRKASR